MSTSTRVSNMSLRYMRVIARERNDVSHGLLLVLELHGDLLHVLVVGVHQGVHAEKIFFLLKMHIVHVHTFQTNKKK